MRSTCKAPLCGHMALPQFDVCRNHYLQQVECSYGGLIYCGCYEPQECKCDRPYCDGYQQWGRDEYYPCPCSRCHSD